MVRNYYILTYIIFFKDWIFWRFKNAMKFDLNCKFYLATFFFNEINIKTRTKYSASGPFRTPFCHDIWLLFETVRKKKKLQVKELHQIMVEWLPINKLFLKTIIWLVNNVNEWYFFHLNKNLIQAGFELRTLISNN